eukprot:7384779-Prymnesium_polylepis.1
MVILSHSSALPAVPKAMTNVVSTRPIQLCSLRHPAAKVSNCPPSDVLGPSTALKCCVLRRGSASSATTEARLCNG